MQRFLPDIKQHSQETGFHTTGGNGTRHPSKRAAADRRLRPRDHRDRPLWRLVEEVISADGEVWLDLSAVMKEIL